MKQTAVEWLIDQVNTAKWKFADKTDREAIIQQAKEMEEEQIIESYSSGYTDSSNKYRFNRDYYNTKYTLKQE